MSIDTLRKTQRQIEAGVPVSHELIVDSLAECCQLCQSMWDEASNLLQILINVAQSRTYWFRKAYYNECLRGCLRTMREELNNTSALLCTINLLRCDFDRHVICTFLRACTSGRIEDMKILTDRVNGLFPELEVPAVITVGNEVRKLTAQLIEFEDIVFFMAEQGVNFFGPPKVIS